MKHDSHELDRMICREELMGRVIQENARICRPSAADVDRLAGPSSTEGARDVETLEEPLGTCGAGDSGQGRASSSKHPPDQAVISSEAPAHQRPATPVEPDEQEDEDMEVDSPECEHLSELQSESESDTEPKISESKRARLKAVTVVMNL